MAKFSPKWYKNNVNERVELKWKSCLWLQLCVASFRNYNVKFEVIEEKSSLINPVDESNVDEIQSDDELNNLITALEKSYKEADTALRDAIDRVQANLDTAIFNFSVVILNNKNDIERKLNDVIKAYELADSVINGKIKRLENKDTELNNLITTLEKTYKEADVALQDAINILQTNLNNAVSDLNTSISNNKQEIKEELRVAKEAYDAANVVINSKFASLA